MAFDYESYRKQRLSGGNLDGERISFDDMRRAQAQSAKYARNQKDWIDFRALRIDTNNTLHFWIQIASPEVAMWVNMAQQKAIQQYRMGKRTWHHQFSIGVADVTIDLRGRSVHIRVLGGTAYFEFETSGMPVMLQTLTQGDIVVENAYKAAVVSVDFGSGGFKATILKGARQESTYNSSKIKRGHQVNLIDEPTITTADPVKEGEKPPKPKIRFPNLLLESWAPNHPYTGVYMRAYNRSNGLGHLQRGSLDVHGSRDIGYDVPWADGRQMNAIRFAYLQGGSDWPRASGKATIKHSTHGEREFAVYVDAFSNFFVFPTATIEPLHFPDPYEQNVDTKYVKWAGVDVLFPDWVHRPTTQLRDEYAASGDTDIIGRVEIDWKLHPNCAKACAVVFERQSADYDQTYFDNSVDPDYPDKFTEADFIEWRDFHTGMGNRHRLHISDADRPQRYFIGTGLLEVELHIDLTGTALEDFTFSLSLTEVRRPTTSLYCTTLAGYVHYDLEGDEKTTPPTYIASKGDFVVMDIERWYQDRNDFTVNDEPQYGVLVIYSVKNLTRGTELRAWSGGRYGMRLLDYDMPTLSFVFDPQVHERFTRTGIPLRPGYSGPAFAFQEYMRDHPAAIIITFNKLRKILYPDIMEQEHRDQIEDYILHDPRAIIESEEMYPPLSVPYHGPFTLIPLNDMRTWYNDSGMADHRHAYFNGHYQPVTAPPGAPITANYWNYALYAYFQPDPLVYVSTPRIGWYVYADEIMNMMYVSPRSTFFVHPNGTWAFFDIHTIYNKHGMYGEPLEYDTLRAFQEDPEALEHVIHDYVHLESKNGSVNTSFIALYNKAVADGIKNKTLTEEFQQVTKDDLRVVFTKQKYTAPEGCQWLQLRVYWYPFFLGHYYELSYVSGPTNAGWYPDVNGLRDLTMGAPMYPDPNYGTSSSGGTMVIPSWNNTPVTFSTCTMVA